VSDQPPILLTHRLRLRPFEQDDAPIVQAHVADRDIAATTLVIPHPYPPEGAVAWIATHQKTHNDGTAIIWAITLRESGELVGAIDLRPNREHNRTDFGYVIYKPHWNRGYATEAARAIIHFGFIHYGLNRIESHHFENNPASGRVMFKCGMTFEGRMRRQVRKWGVYLDTLHYAILRDEYDARRV